MPGQGHWHSAHTVREKRRKALPRQDDTGTQCTGYEEDFAPVCIGTGTHTVNGLGEGKAPVLAMLRHA